MQRYGWLLAGVLTMGLAMPVLADKDSEWDSSVDRAISYLRKTQAKDGSWGGKQAPGVTGVVVTGLLRTGKVTTKDPMVSKALGYIESLINPKQGHIAGNDPNVKLHNYVTSVNLMALVAADRPSYKAAIKDATAFLKK